MRFRHIEVQAQIDDQSLRIATGANILDLSEQQVLLLLQRYSSGGWYTYCASKAALNMIIKNATIKIGRRNK